MSAVALVGVKIRLVHLKALEIKMRKLVLDLSLAQILPEKINKKFLPKSLDSLMCCKLYLNLNIFLFSVDATKETSQLGRLINHSRGAPNLEVVAVVQNRQKRLALISSKTILAGEELLFDYGETRSSALSDLPWLLE